MSRAQRRAAAVLAIVAAVLTSCGGGDDDAASTQAPTTGPSTTRASASVASSAPPLEGPAPGGFAECVGAEQPVLSAFDATTGAERWTTCGDAGRQRTVVGVDDQRAFIVEQPSNPASEAASRPSALIALNPAGGVEQWRFERSGRLAVPPGTFTSDGVIVAHVSAADGEELVGIDATSGEARWSEPLGVGQRAVASSPAVVVVDRGVDAPTMTTAGPDGRPPTPTSTWVGLDRRRGAELWTADIGLDDGGGAPPSAAADETTIVVTSPTLMALDAATGAVRWTSPSGDDVAAIGRIVDGMLLTGGQGVDVVARSVDTGDVRWTRPGSTPYDDVWAVTEGAVVVRDGEELVSYAVADGVERWRQPIDAESYAWPWLGHDDVLYAMWWNLEARSAADGSLRWATDHPVGAEPIDATPRMTSVARVGQLLVVAYAVGATGGD